MESKKQLKDFVKCFKNKRNNQNIIIPSSKKLKKFNMDIDDILNMELNKKIENFKKG